MDFKYKAIDENNKVIEGTESAKTKFELANFLKTQGLVLIEAERASIKKFTFFKKFLELSTVGTQEKISFTRNIGAMIEAGLSLSRALSVMEKQSKNKKMKKTVQEINIAVKKGESLSEAITHFPKMFDDLYVSMVKSGE